MTTLLRRLGPRTLLAGLLLARGGAVAAQGSRTPNQGGVTPTPGVWRHQLSLEHRATGGTRIEEGGAGRGSYRADDAELSFIERVPVSEALSLMLGAGYARTELRAAGVPLPGLLQGASLRLGAEWLHSPRWWVFVNAQPGLYGDNDLTGDDFTLPGDIQVNYLRRPGLRWVAGLAVSPFNERAVSPFAGAVWRLNRRWNLNLLPPKLRVEYRAVDDGAKRVELFSGLAFSGGAYRVSGDLGTRRGRPELNGRRLSRREGGTEAGVSWEWRGLKAEASVGWRFMQRFKYSDGGAELKAKAAPYGALSLSSRW